MGDPLTLIDKGSRKLGSDADQDLAALVLRVLGITPDEARAIASRPLPSVDTHTGDQQP